MPHEEEAQQMTTIKRHMVDGLPKSVSPSSHAVEADGFVFLTGQFGRNLESPDDALPAGIEAQTERTLQNVERALASLGMTLRNVVSVRVFLTSFKRDYEGLNAVYARFFPEGARPVRTCVGVTDLVRDALVEIDCVAKR
jgi:2-iminobutanoate/2-iminopropanoate deaminase